MRISETIIIEITDIDDNTNIYTSDEIYLRTTGTTDLATIFNDMKERIVVEMSRLGALDRFIEGVTNES